MTFGTGNAGERFPKTADTGRIRVILRFFEAPRGVWLRPKTHEISPSVGKMWANLGRWWAPFAATARRISSPLVAIGRPCRLAAQRPIEGPDEPGRATGPVNCSRSCCSRVLTSTSRPVASSTRPAMRARFIMRVAVLTLTPSCSAPSLSGPSLMTEASRYSLTASRRFCSSERDSSARSRVRYWP